MIVLLESPYAGDTERNIKYGRRCLKDSLSRGESPMASHLLYTQPGVLNDDDPEERMIGINRGHAWMSVARKVVVYTDLGISPGMQLAINRAEMIGVPVEMRSIGTRGEDE